MRLACSVVPLLFAACSTAGTGPSGAPDAGDDDDDDVPAADAAPVAPDATVPAPDAAPQGHSVSDCFEGVFVNGVPDLGPDYDQFGPVVGEHCVGTDHQDITGVERVVFLGDSVTVGTPPTLSDDFYRSILADELAARFGLDGPDLFWKQVNLLDGVAMVQESGDFASCAEWGARTDDLLRDDTQIEDCFPVEERGKRTLVIMTIGGNDIANITKDGIDDVPVPDLWEDTEEFIQLLRDAIDWLREPGRFPNGVHVVFANMFEYTDGTGDTEACPAAGLAGFGAEWDDPQALEDIVVWANEQYARIAVETGADMVFMLESFCGHGFNHDDTSGPCYRGPDAARWFDDTCIHPNPTGHQALADLFLQVIDE